MKSFKTLVLAFFLCFLFVSLVSAKDKVILLNQGGSGGSSQWTGTTTITPTTATSTAAGYTSNVTTGVFQFGTQASEGMRYSSVIGGGRLGIGTTAPTATLSIIGVAGTNPLSIAAGVSFLSLIDATTDQMVFGDTSGTFSAYPNGWYNHDGSKLFRIWSPDATHDTGIMIGRNGIGPVIWTDNTEVVTYYDDMYNNASAKVVFRMRSAGTPVKVLTILGSGNIGLGTSANILASGSGPFMGYTLTNGSPVPYSGTAGFYAADSGGGTIKMFAADDAGGTAALTPHANYADWGLTVPETDNPYPMLQGPFIQQALGVEVVYDIERMAIAMAAFADGKPCPYPPGTKFAHWRSISEAKKIDLKTLKRNAWKDSWIQANTIEEEVAELVAVDDVSKTIKSGFLEKDGKYYQKIIPSKETSEAATVAGFLFKAPAGLEALEAK